MRIDSRQQSPQVSPLSRAFPGVARVHLPAFLLLTCIATLRAADCNLNGVDDTEDLAAGSSADCNEDGLPDECEVPAIRATLDGHLSSGDEVARAVFFEDFDGDAVPDIALGTATGVFVWVSPATGPGDGATQVFTPSDDALGSWRQGELDGDGDIDFIAVKSGADPPQVALLENNGDATFSVLGHVEFGAAIFWLLFEDLSGDGRADIIVTQRAAGTVEVSLSQPDGTLGTPVTYTVGTFPGAAETADIDGDGDLDVVVVNRNTNDVSLLRNEGGGIFAEAVSFPLGVDFPERVALVDLQNDGLPDVVTLHARAAVILQNHNGATFDAPHQFFLEQPRFPGVIKAEDLDADGDVDLVATSPREVGLQIFWNAGGVFSTTGFVDAEVTPPAMHMADIDSDGDLDWLVSCRENPGARFLWNLEGERREGISFRAPVNYPANGEPHGFELDDLDVDGDIDVITANNELGAGLSTLLNRGDGTLAPGIAHIQGGEVFSVAPGDFDADGDLDIVAADASGQQVQLVWNSGNATYDSSTVIEIPGKPWFVTAADLDGVEGDDVVAAIRGTGVVTILRNFADGRFAVEDRVVVAGGPTAVAVADLDGDARLDIAVSSVGAARVTTLMNRGTFNDGTADFSEERRFALTTPPNFVTAADYDGDGHMDLAVASAEASDVTVLWNRGDATFEASPPLETGLAVAMSLTSGDLDGDGLPEIITVHPSTDTIGILLNAAGRDFRATGGRATGQGRGPRFAQAADLDGRGELDITTANHDSFSVTVFLNERQSLEGDGFLERLCTVKDFRRVSVASPQNVFERETQYLVPAREDPALLGPLFQDVERFALQESFLQQTFPDRFGTLSADEYLQLVGRRATRSYHAGRLQLLQREGVPMLTFDVVADTERDPGEVLGLAEVEAARTRLAQAISFAPLVYRPQDELARREARSWIDPGFPLLIEESDVGPPPEERPTFTLEVPPETTLCGVFSKERVDRTLRTEYELKSTALLKSGLLLLPTTAETFQLELFEEVRVGAALALATAVSEGLFRVVAIPANQEETVYRFIYEQEFRLPGGEHFELRLLNLDFRRQISAPEPEPLLLDDHLLTFSLAFDGSIDGTPSIRYAPCGYDLLPHWEVAVEAADGTILELTERFDPSENLLDTGPAALVSAAVAFPNVSPPPVRDYWRLVYAAARHNRRARYWVELVPHVALPGLEKQIRFVELQAPEAEDNTAAALRYLGSDFELLAEASVTSFVKRRLLTTSANFRRGDFDSSGDVDVSDPLALARFVFTGGLAPPCRSSGDFNDNGALNLLDVIRLVGYLFRNDPPPPLPFAECGPDPTEDGLGCESFPPCG